MPHDENYVATAEGLALQMAAEHRVLTEVRDIAVGTARDVSWIKETMGMNAIALTGFEHRLRAVENRQHWYAGAAAAISALATHLGWKFTSGGH